MGLANGTTIAFGTSSFIANIRRIGGTNETRGVVETHHLASTGQKTKIPESLTEPGTMEVEFEWDQSFTVFPPIGGAAETITITYPLKTGETNNAVHAGTGFLIEAEGPTLEDAALMIGRLVIQWDGLTDHGYTKGN